MNALFLTLGAVQFFLAGTYFIMAIVDYSEGNPVRGTVASMVWMLVLGMALLAMGSL